MTREIYTSKDGKINIVRAAMFCDECGQKGNCMHLAAAVHPTPQLTLCIPCFANLMHFIIAGRKYER